MGTPSMDDKATPSPPQRTTQEYEWDKAHGINSKPFPTTRPGLKEPKTMPPVSEKQRRAMRAAASGKSTLGIPASVGKEYSKADKGGKLPRRANKGKGKR